MRERWRRRSAIGLRTRAAIAAGVAALVVAASLSTITYFATRSYLLNQRESAAIRQAFSNARLLQDRRVLSTPEEALAAVRTEPGGLILLADAGNWRTAGAGVGPTDLPATVLDAVEAGQSGHQRAAIAGATMLVTVVALPGQQVAYVEIVPLVRLEESLRALLWALVVGSAIATALGSLLGVWTTRRALRPLTATAVVAERVASGHLDERLPDSADADLARFAVAFNGMTEVLQRRLERESRFASDVSHELRTPLATISLATASLERRRDELSDRSRQALDLVVTSAHELERLVVDLLDLARAELPTDDALEIVPFAGTVRAIVHQCAGADTPVVSTSDRLEREVPLDRRRLERVLRNLVDNADRYAGGVSTITLVDHGAWATILVDDEGPGIDEGEIDHIFDRFARGGATQDIPGSGLGLALVREHLGAMGGTVEVANRLGGGARFSVTVPLPGFDAGDVS